MNAELYKILNPKAIRVFLLHDLLKCGKSRTMKEMMKLMLKTERISSYYSVRSFREDIRFMREELEAPITISNRGIYRYSTPYDLYMDFGMEDRDPCTSTYFSNND